MRKVSILLAFVACTAPALSQAQHRDPSAEIASPAEADGDGMTRGKSGFGQIMSVLTGLLQEAAVQQVGSGRSNGSRLLSSDQSAVTITVTPVAGRSSFFVDKSSANRNAGQPVAGTATLPTRVTATTMGAAHDAQMAMQAEGDFPD